MDTKNKVKLSIAVVTLACAIGLIAWYVERRNKDFAEKYTLAGASGIMAGASLMGIVIIVFSQVVPLFATP